MAKNNRQRLPLLYIMLGGIAFVAALNYIMGSPIQKWFDDPTNMDQPLIWAAVLMLAVAILPFVILINLGEDKNEK